MIETRQWHPVGTLINSDFAPTDYGKGRHCTGCGKTLNSWHKGDTCYQCDGDGQHSIEDVWDAIRDDLELARDLNQYTLQAICKSSYPIEPEALRHFFSSQLGSLADFCRQAGLRFGTVRQQILRGKLSPATEGKVLEALFDKEERE